MVFRHLPHIIAQAEFSACSRYRYRLTLIDSRKKSGTTVCVIMQNPSVADEHKADKSVQFLEKLIFEKGLPEFSKVSSCVIINLFARVQTRNFKGEPSDIGKDNDQYLRRAIEASDMVLIAWGKTNPFEERQKVVLDLLGKNHGKELLMTKKHPSRGSYQDFIIPFEV